MHSRHGEDPLSDHLESAAGEAAARYNSALDMTLKVKIQYLNSRLLISSFHISLLPHSL